MANNIIEALDNIDVALGGTAGDAINLIDSLNQIGEGVNNLKNSVDNINGVDIKICGAGEYNVETGVPTVEDPVEGVFYLTPANNQQNNNIFNEYYIKNGQWEMFGGAGIDVSSLFDLSDRMAKGVDASGHILDGAIVEGNLTYNKALNAYAHAEGSNTIASGDSSHAEGNGGTFTLSGVSYTSEASGQYSHTEGHQTIAAGMADHAEGYRTRTESGQPGNHAEGYQTAATGGASHAEGSLTIASGSQSHAEGGNTIASGALSHAEGNQTAATGDYSHAEGYSTIANHRSQHVFGEYNIEDPSSGLAINRGTYVEIIGNGMMQNARSNARTLDWFGNETLSGSLSLVSSLTLGKGTADEVTITAAQLKSLIALLNNN